MNPAQRKVLLGLICGISLTFAFPPFVIESPDGGRIAGAYSFILYPPSKGMLSGVIDTPLLLAEWLAIIVVSIALIALRRSPDQTGPIARLVRSYFDVKLECARIEADAIIRVAEINATRE